MPPVLSPSHNGSRKLVIDDILDLRAYINEITKMN